jgi:hypothetical protein
MGEAPFNRLVLRQCGTREQQSGGKRQASELRHSILPARSFVIDYHSLRLQRQGAFG